MANKIPIVSFNSGLASPLITERVDVEKYSSLCKQLSNFIPREYGCAERRPGTKYFATANNTSKVRTLPFIYSSTTAYVVELGDLYARIYDATSLVDEVVTPYLEADLFELQIRQVGDVMWITHPDYAQRKLTRTDATTFSLDIIVFKRGPFRLRNDLVDPDLTDAGVARMLYTPDTGEGTDVGDTGVLSCEDSTGTSVSFFDVLHGPSATGLGDGALFKLTHNRWNKISKGKFTGVTTGIICPAIDVKGEYRWQTHGNWYALIELQKNENNAGWETIESYEGAKDVNVLITKTEDADNVQYRVNVSDQTGTRASSTIKSSITVLKDVIDGIVRVTEYIDEYSANVEVVVKMESAAITAITKANPAVVTVAGHNFRAGDEIIIAQVSGMTEINGAQTVLKVLTSSTFQLDLNSTFYGVYTSGGIITRPATKRWAEGVWSGYRGFPNSVTFFEDRCIYITMADLPEVVEAVFPV